MTVTAATTPLMNVGGGLPVEQLPEGWYLAPQAYLRAVVAVGRSPRPGEFIVVHFGSGTIYRTDRLGALAVSELIGGRSGAEVMETVERIETGSGDRLRRLICMLGLRGAMTLWPPARSGKRWLLRRYVCRALGISLGVATPVSRWLPTPILALTFGLLARLATPHGASGPEDVDRGGRRSLNSLFNYLSLGVEPRRLRRLVERLFDAHSLDRVAEDLERSGPTIGVFLHGPLSAGVPNALRSRGYSVVRAVESRTHGINLSALSGSISFYFGDPSDLTVDVTAPLSTASLLRRLKNGDSVYVALDAGGERRGAKVEMLGRSVPRNDGPAWLAVRSGRPVALWTTHTKAGRTVLTASPLMFPNDSLPVADRVGELSERLHRQAEAAIWEHPAAWTGWKAGRWASGGGAGWDYNYEAFSLQMEEPELARWLDAGPHPGELAPDFHLDDLDGRTVRLSTLRGTWVVIEFGSYTCQTFSEHVPEMERLAREHPDAAFLVIGVREAHPGEITGPHRSWTQKVSAANRLAAEDRIVRPMLVDDLEGTVHRSYGGTWNPVYVIDPEGKVAYRRAWNDPLQVEQALEALAAGRALTAAESIEMAALPPDHSPIGLRMLERGGRKALLDVYRSSPLWLRRRLKRSPSRAVREALDRTD